MQLLLQMDMRLAMQRIALNSTLLLPQNFLLAWETYLAFLGWRIGSLLIL